LPFSPALSLPGMTEPASLNQAPQSGSRPTPAGDAPSDEARITSEFSCHADPTPDHPLGVEGLFDIGRRIDPGSLSDSPDISHRTHSHHSGLDGVRVVLIHSEGDLLICPSKEHLAGAGHVALWFCRKGRMLFSDRRGSVDALPGELVVTPLSADFSISCEVGKNTAHETVCAVLPRDRVEGLGRGTAKRNVFKPTQQSEYGFAADMLASLCEHESGLAPESSALLRESALTIVDSALQRPVVDAASTSSIRDVRISQIVRYIEVRLSDANLSHASTARDCGVSPRYLTSLLNSHGRNFTEMVWQLRLEKAKSWLASSTARDISIAEIAFGLGFKSPCHFSRLFRKVYNASPRDFRPPPGHLLAANR
jgi:AraC family transcriptional activator of tynA and feaB